MAEMSDVASWYGAGRWVGSDVQGMPIQWAIALTPRSEFPSAFGGTDDGSVLAGTWNGNGSKLTLRCGQQPQLLHATLAERGGDGGAPKLEGTTGWHCTLVRAQGEENAKGGEQQQDVVAVRPDIPDGLWSGEAIPDDSLEPFMIPTNPIMWCLASSCTDSGDWDGTKDDPRKKKLFGGGFFDDAADVPGQPTLFFTLNGTATATMAEEEGEEVSVISFDVSKKYEAVDGSSGVDVAAHVVNFVGKLAGADEQRNNPAEAAALTGKWTNEFASTFGHFMCQLVPADEDLAAAVLCSVCHRPCPDGKVALECAECDTPWRLCSRCSTTSEQEGTAGGVDVDMKPDEVKSEMKTSKHQHQHPLSEVMVFTRDAVDPSGPLATMIIQSFSLFSDRLLTGTTTYNQMEKDALRYAAVLQHRFRAKRGSRLVIAESLDDSYIAAVLGAVLAGCVLVPLPPPSPRRIMNDEDRSEVVEVPEEVKPYIDHRDVLLSCALGDDLLPPATLVLREGGDPAAILYTSGSTGKPKGVVYSEDLVRPSGGLPNTNPLVRLDFQDFHPSFLLSLLAVVRCGGSRAICTNHVTLFEDVRRARPTHISAPPAFYSALANDPEPRRALGNRIVSLVCGGGPPNYATLAHLSILLKCKIHDLYGSRETGPIAQNGVLHSNVQAKLLRHEDGRDELLVRTPRLISGYFNKDSSDSSSMSQDEVNREAALLDGKLFRTIDGVRYYRTGDAAQLHGNTVRITGRVGEMIKMKDATWFAPQTIEDILERSPHVHQCFVFSEAFTLTAVCVLNLPASQPQGGTGAGDSQGNEEEQQQLLSPTDLLKHIRFLAAHHGCKHLPMAVVALPRSEESVFSVENGCLTSTRKKRRGPMLEKFSSLPRTTLEDLHQQSSSPNTTSGTTANNRAGAVHPKLEAALRQLLPQSTTPTGGGRRADFDADATVTELGLDSLATARVASITGLSVASLLKFTLSHLSILLSSNDNTTTQHLSGGVSTDNHVDWEMEVARIKEKVEHLGSHQKTSSRETTKPSPESSTVCGPSSTTYLLTGGTGFVGSHILAKLLTEGSKVFCLVRSEEGLQAALAAIPFTPTDVQTRNLVVFRGSLNAPLFGLDQVPKTSSSSSSGGTSSGQRVGEVTWSQLCLEVTHIIHCGANVNMSAPYEVLAPTNVEGTLTCLQLALEGGGASNSSSGSSEGQSQALPKKKKKFHYVSTVAVCSTSSSETWLDGTPSEILSALSTGYARSKAVTELALRHAQEFHGLDVTITRLSGVCGSISSGNCNPRDALVVCLSFCCHVLHAAVHASPLRLHWVPVDFAATAIYHLGLVSENNASASSGGVVYHVAGDDQGQGKNNAATTFGDIAKMLPGTKSVSGDDWPGLVDRTPLLNSMGRRSDALRPLFRSLPFNSKGPSPVDTRKAKEALKQQGILWWDGKLPLGAMVKWIAANPL